MTSPIRGRQTVVTRQIIGWQNRCELSQFRVNGGGEGGDTYLQYVYNISSVNLHKLRKLSVFVTTSYNVYSKFRLLFCFIFLLFLFFVQKKCQLLFCLFRSCLTILCIQRPGFQLKFLVEVIL